MSRGRPKRPSAGARSGGESSRPPGARGRGPSSSGRGTASKAGAGRRAPRPPARFRRTILVWLAATAAVVVSSVSARLAWSLSPASEPGNGEPVLISLATSDRESVTRALETAGLIKSPRLFRFYLEVLLPTVELEAGEHLLRRGLSPRELAARLGRLPGRPSTSVLVPEGFHRKKIALRLEKAEVCSAQAFLDATAAPALLAELKLDGPSVEGYLFPATYELAHDTRPDDVVRRMVHEARKRLDAARAKHPGAAERLAAKEFTERDLITLASIVERETALGDERRLIASVFFNRLSDPSLEPKGRLQSDPTAAYGCEYEPERAASCASYVGRVTPAMLRDPDNRYNTDRNAGLPPGAIASPGLAALEAVLDPSQSDYLYFVADGAGRHTFSRTFEEHQAAVERLRALRGPTEASPLAPATLQP